jgi:hypothetical protein
VVVRLPKLDLFSEQALSNVRANASGHVSLPPVSIRGDYQAGDLQLKVAINYERVLP